jgi:hypothetical protein
MPHPRLKPFALFSCLVLTLSSAAFPVDAARKTARKSQPVAPSHAAPDRTATIPRPTPPVAAPPPAADDETLPKPFDLPAAPRSRMRACGERWQSIKMAGQAADQTWREFATGCLADTSGERRPTRP